MNRNKILQIIKFSIFKKVQNKAFVILNLLLLLVSIYLVNANVFLEFFSQFKNNQIVIIAVVDKENILYDEFVKSMQENHQFEIERIDENTYTEENMPNDFAVVEVEPNDEEVFQVSFISKQAISAENTIINKMKEIRNQKIIDQYRLDEKAVSLIQSNLTVNRIMLSVNEENEEGKFWANYIMGYIIFMLIIYSISNLNTEIITEKQSKSTEYILTSVSAKEYLCAKIASTVILILMQFMLTVAYYLIATVLGFMLSADAIPEMGSAASSIAIDKSIISLILISLVLNVLNLIILLMIQATITSRKGSPEEASNSMMLIFTVVMILYGASVSIFSASKKVILPLKIISCLPIISSFFIPSIHAVDQLSIVQVIASILLLLISIPFVFNYCSETFKNGILDYTKINTLAKKKEEDAQKIFLNKRNMHEFALVVGLAIIVFLVTQLLVGLMVPLILNAFASAVLDDTTINLITQALTLTLSAFFACKLVHAYTEKEPKNHATKTYTGKQKVSFILVSLFIIVAVQLMSSMIYPIIGIDYDMVDMVFDISSTSGLFTKLLFVIVIAMIPAIAEEKLFREAIIQYSMQYGSIFAVIFSSLLFGLVHGNVAQFIFAFIIGMVLGAVYIITKDLRVTMMIHFINNLYSAFYYLVPEGRTAILDGVAIAVAILGLLVTVKLLSKKEHREMVKNVCHLKLSGESFKGKYRYIFTEYVFVIAVLVVISVTILNEIVLRMQ